MNKSHFDIYTDYLICSFGLTTATGLSRLLDGEISHDQVTRLLSTPAKTSADLWRVVKPLVRQVESDNGLLIFDDSIEEKPYTDENDLICWHWDHSKKSQCQRDQLHHGILCGREGRVAGGFRSGDKDRVLR